MHQALTPFEAFAQNMSGTTIGVGTPPYVNLQAGLPLRGIGDGLSDTTDGNKTLWIALGVTALLGAGIFYLSRSRSRR